MSETIGLYLHIPFCKSKCPYCDFFSGKGSENDYDSYVLTLTDKIQFWGNQTDKAVSSIYLGGGTPSIIGSDRLCMILESVYKNFNVSKGAEITAEVNPDSGKNIDFALLKKYGFNRISVGMQSAVADELNALGRIHTANDASCTVEKAKNSGIDNISLDLMMGTPNQTIDSLKDSIQFCSDCGVTHISSYLLKIEEGTKYDSLREKLQLPDDDMQAELYLFAVDYLSKLGYQQYEISNFSKIGFESRHNINYWKCGEYIGIGPSAHSFLNGKRFYYDRNMKNFIDNKITIDGDGGSNEEYIMLALRLKQGLDFAEYQSKFGEPLPPRFFNKITNYAKCGYMETNENSCCFTPKGFLVSNTILSELL